MIANQNLVNDNDAQDRDHLLVDPSEQHGTMESGEAITMTPRELAADANANAEVKRKVDDLDASSSTIHPTIISSSSSTSSGTSSHKRKKKKHH